MYVWVGGWVGCDGGLGDVCVFMCLSVCVWGVEGLKIIDVKNRVTSS